LTRKKEKKGGGVTITHSGHLVKEKKIRGKGAHLSRKIFSIRHAQTEKEEEEGGGHPHFEGLIGEKGRKGKKKGKS